MHGGSIPPFSTNLTKHIQELYSTKNTTSNFTKKYAMKKAQDYGNVINPADYTQGLEEHAWVPQSDEGIIKILFHLFNLSNKNTFNVLDLGCGPGRLTKKIVDKAEVPLGIKLTGIDYSEKFIAAAKGLHLTNTEFIGADFLTHNADTKFDAILMQGVAHHLDKGIRSEWFEKCRGILNEEGCLIIGDEFIPDYKDEKGRKQGLVSLYAYVIAEAINCRNDRLAEIEAMNMVDDICADTEAAGHSDEKLREAIKRKSVEFFEALHEKGLRSEFCQSFIRNTPAQIIKAAESISKANSTENHDRGDYKISIAKMVKEIEGYGFEVVNMKRYGPLENIGGMANIVFKKIYD